MNLHTIKNIPLELRVELGRQKISVEKLLALQPGSVIELDKLAGEVLDIFINDQRLGAGEVVIVNEKFAIRITDIYEKK